MQFQHLYGVNIVANCRNIQVENKLLRGKYFLKQLENSILKTVSMRKQAKMSPLSSNTYQQIALILLVLCIVSPIESRFENKERKQEKSIGIQQTSTQPQLTPPQGLSLCKKDRTLSFLCHCTPDDENIKSQKGL